MELEVTPTRNLTSNAESSLTAQSSHLFQNAADFEIVGGQFVVGDIHNHLIMDRGRELTSLLSTNSTDTYAESEIYCSQLLRQRRGCPLYSPSPQRNLPEEYKKCGVSIGDVGRVTPEGIFDFFFNIYLPADHPINANDVPDDFSPLAPYARRDLFYEDYEPGSCVSTPSVQLDFSSENEFPGSEFIFKCGAPHGAVLALPHGSHLEKLENLENMRQYAGQHAESWYKYVTGPRGRKLANGSLYLVTGCEKTRSWGMASFYGVREEVFELRFKPTQGTDTAHNYRWTGINARRRSFNPSPTHGNTLNQATFIHGLSISLGKGIWGRLFGDVKICEIMDYQLGNSAGDSGSRPQGSSVFSWSLSTFGGGSASGGKQHGCPGEEVLLSDSPPVSKIFHPAEIINNYILEKSPHATVVMSHDDDWRDILQDDGTRTIIQHPAELLQHINDHFDVMEQNGVTFLLSKAAFSRSDTTIVAEVSTRNNAPTPAPIRFNFAHDPGFIDDNETASRPPCRDNDHSKRGKKKDIPWPSLLPAHGAQSQNQIKVAEDGIAALNLRVTESEDNLDKLVGERDRLKRPENAFTLFRRKYLENITLGLALPSASLSSFVPSLSAPSSMDSGPPSADSPTLVGNVPGAKKQRQANLSKMISQHWKALGPAQHGKWEALAKEKRREHEMLHPNWVYRPQRSSAKNRTSSSSHPSYAAASSSTAPRPRGGADALNPNGLGSNMMEAPASANHSLLQAFAPWPAEREALDHALGGSTNTSIERLPSLSDTGSMPSSPTVAHAHAHAAVPAAQRALDNEGWLSALLSPWNEEPPLVTGDKKEDRR